MRWQPATVSMGLILIAVTIFSPVLCLHAYVHYAQFQAEKALELEPILNSHDPLARPPEGFVQDVLRRESTHCRFVDAMPSLTTCKGWWAPWRGSSKAAGWWRCFPPGRSGRGGKATGTGVRAGNGNPELQEGAGGKILKGKRRKGQGPKDKDGKDKIQSP